MLPPVLGLSVTASGDLGKSGRGVHSVVFRAPKMVNKGSVADVRGKGGSWDSLVGCLLACVEGEEGAGCVCRGFASYGGCQGGGFGECLERGTAPVIFSVAPPQLAHLLSSVLVLAYHVGHRTSRTSGICRSQSWRVRGPGTCGIVWGQ